MDAPKRLTEMQQALYAEITKPKPVRKGKRIPVKSEANWSHELLLNPFLGSYKVVPF